MIKLELDWAAEELPELGSVLGSDDEAELVVEVGMAEGPAAGHPTVVVYAGAKPGSEERVASMALVSWLASEYTAGDWDEADELAGMAVEV